MESVYNLKEACCGCSACYSICPVSAISMVEDEKGFKYPVINKELCINCKKCVSICPLKENLKKVSDQRVLALKNKDEITRVNSSSGGFFTEIAKKVIEENGVVYGAIFDAHNKVVHNQITCIDDIKKLRGSKYVQSDIRDTYKSVKKYLKEQKKVLFSGTPCQVFGLIKYLGKDYQNLITCDFVCHGVPSPKIFEEHRKFLENKYNSEAKKISFTYKINNTIKNMKVTFKNQKKYIMNSNKDKFYFLFLKNYILRESCYNCHFSNTNRVADITMGDFWGISKTIKDFDDGKGVSLVIINSKKGLETYEKVQEKFYCRESNIKDCLQPNLEHPTIKPNGVDTFWCTYHKNGFKKSVSKMKRVYFINRVKNKIKKLIK